MSQDDSREALSAELDGELSPEERALLETELASSSELQGEREALGQVAERVRKLPRLEVPAHFTAQVMAKLAQEAPVAVGAQAGGQAAGQADVAVRASLSAYLDGALPDSERAAVSRRLADDAGLREELDRLRHTRDRVLALPRITTPPNFLSRVLAGVDRIEQENLRRAEARRALRAAWWGRVGQVVQAASLLLVVAGGAMLAEPAAVVPGALRYLARSEATVGGEVNPARGGDRGVFAQAPRLAPGQRDQAVQLEEPGFLPGGDYDAVVKLETEDEAASLIVADQLRRFADAIEGEVESEGYAGFVAQVPANQTDDLLLALETAELGLSGEGRAQLEAAHTELDRVELKSGFVYVGRVRRTGNRIVVQAGDTVLVFDAREVVSLTPAATPRRLRIEVRERD